MRRVASAACSVEIVSEVTVAPRAAARIASSPHPVPISSTLVPSPTPAASSSRSILRRCATASGSDDPLGSPSKTADE